MMYTYDALSLSGSPEIRPPVNEVRRAEIIEQLHTTNRPFICHKAISQDLDLVCRGFYDEEPNLVVRLAQMLEIVEYADLPGKATPKNPRRATLRGHMRRTTSGGACLHWTEPRPPHVAIYARVSTDDKDQNPETQLMPLREYCQRRRPI